VVEQKQMTCAKCGDLAELCGSARMNDIQQPRICKDCLISAMNTGDYEINDTYWLTQLAEAGDTVSLKKLEEQDHD